MWYKISIQFRIFIVLSILTLSLITFIWQNIYYFIPAVLLLIIFLYLKAIKLYKFYFWIGIPILLFLIYSIILNSIYGTSSVGFISYLPSVLFTILTLLLVSHGIYIEEWIIISQNFAPVFRPIIIAIGSGRSSATKEFMDLRLAYKVSNSRFWLKDTALSRLSALYELVVYFVINLAMFNYSNFKNWIRQNTNNTIENSMKIDEIYSVKYFPLIYDRLFTTLELSLNWENILEKYLRDKKNILEIGAGSGKLTEWLLKSKFNLVESLEPNSELRDLANDKLRQFEFQISQDSFSKEFDESKKFDAIVMHQNVFLELINQMPVDEIINKFKKILLPNSFVIFDYPINPEIPDNNAFNNLFSGEIQGVGLIKYGYKYLGAKNINNYQLQLIYEIYNRKKSMFILNYAMSVYLPVMDEIREKIIEHGITIAEIKETSYFSFFSKSLDVIVLQFNRSQ